MRFLSVIFTALLAGLAATGPVPARVTAATTPWAPVAKQWTLDEVSRKRTQGDQTCEWRMTILQLPSISIPITTTTTSSSSSTSSSASNSTAILTVHCDFRVQAGGGGDCGTASFGRTRCSESHRGFYVSGGHNDDGGFVVVVVEDLDVGADDAPLAFFGFPDAALDSGAAIPPQTSRVLVSGG